MVGVFKWILRSLKNKKVIIIAGATATGKTAVAIEIAKHFHTAIISADSRQCYRELNIGVARPSAEELNTVIHYFIASHSITENVNAASFEAYALEKAQKLFQNHDTIIMVGGTGLYIKAFCEGLDEIPAVKDEIRKSIISTYEKEGLEWLQEQIKTKDPGFYQRGEIQNPQRMMRALEVVESTGQSILNFRTGEKAKRDFDIMKIGLELPKEQLHNNINRRVDQMIGQGLVNEVKALEPYKSLNALQTVGYAEIFQYLDGEVTLEEAINTIKANTRRYAKRQLTWFRKDEAIKWFAPGQVKEMIKWVEGLSND
jgi:tRNA dimethylallyltransferase